MKTISLEEALILLDRATAVRIDHDALVYQVIDLDDDTFLYLENDGREWFFRDADNQLVTINGHTLTLKSTRGTLVKIDLLGPLAI